MRGLSDAQYEVLAGRCFGIHPKESSVVAIMYELEREGLLMQRVTPNAVLFDRTRTGWLALRVERACRRHDAGDTTV
jgi:hypothetical protein